MGRAFAEELRELDTTYKWALGEQLDRIREFVTSSRGHPLITIGSGGSLTSARFASLLHEKTKSLSKPVTPFEFLNAGKVTGDASLLLFTAGGRNQDIVKCLKRGAQEDWREMLVICGSKGSKIAETAKKHANVQLVEFDLPAGKDGFLATNSVIAFCVLMLRGYLPYLSGHVKLPPSIAPLICSLHPTTRNDESQGTAARNVLKRDTVVILHGYWGQPAAFDFESKSTEAALNCTQVADYRNFAHGRHHWLAKKGSDTGLIALITPEEASLAKRTLHEIPNNVPRLVLDTRVADPVGAIELILKCFDLIRIAGEIRNIDPGRPGVPEFGRRIYNLRYDVTADPRPTPRRVMDVAIMRKVSSYLEMGEKDQEYWRAAFRGYVKGLRSQSFGILVFDYDGTLCNPRERYQGLSGSVVSALNRLLTEGAVVGVATGRGKSVRQDLQKVIKGDLWKRVHLGYYNGYDIGGLDDDSHPNKDAPVDPEIRRIRDELMKSPVSGFVMSAEIRPSQLTLELKDPYTVEQLFPLVHSFTTSMKADVKVVISSHSIDIINQNVSKQSLVTELKESFAAGPGVTGVLCVGDKGMWPGNDFELLSGGYGLSVDTVSMDPEGCWNLAPPGMRGVPATLFYMERLKWRRNGFIFDYRGSDPDST
ncbi:MAG: hypothetical protein ACLP9K_05415 [Nitrososphaerales archaeon]